MDDKDYPLKKTARLAGFLYFIWILSGLYSLMFIPSQIEMSGDAAATAYNILSNEFLFRTGIINDLINSCIWIVMILFLYRLFKPVNRYLVKLLFAFVIVQIPAVFILEGFNITALMILKGKGLQTFEAGQRLDIAMQFLKFSDYAVLTLEFYWGLWLLPLGILIMKSDFIPRFLGIWLIINGIALLILSFTDILLPQYRNMIFKIAIPAMFGEVAFMLWLLIKGVKNNVSSIENNKVLSI
ncbi:MAG: DUF4386 domain-containing protein [Ignavibacteria bacterium]|nr:DUF4386 domain-containing protein [Ignavibacteria bacterium]